MREFYGENVVCPDLFFLKLENAIERLKIKKIKSKRDFIEKRKTDKELQDIPLDPRSYYKSDWPGWPAALGKLS